MLVREAGRADHVYDAGLRRELREPYGGLGQGEIQDAFHMSEQRMGIVRNRNADCAQPGHLADIPADRGRAFVLQASGDLAARRFVQRPGQSLTHASRSAENRDPHVTHRAWRP